MEDLDKFSIQITADGKRVLKASDKEDGIPPNEIMILRMIENGSWYRVDKLREKKLKGYNNVNASFTALISAGYINATKNS